jgi:hypothetical protein
MKALKSTTCQWIVESAYSFTDRRHGSVPRQFLQVGIRHSLGTLCQNRFGVSLTPPFCLHRPSSLDRAYIKTPSPGLVKGRQPLAVSGPAFSSSSFVCVFLFVRPSDDNPSPWSLVRRQWSRASLPSRSRSRFRRVLLTASPTAAGLRSCLFRSPDPSLHASIKTLTSRVHDLSRSRAHSVPFRIADPSQLFLPELNSRFSPFDAALWR